MPSPSPRTILLIACLAAIVQASPLSKPPSSTTIHLQTTTSTPLENLGTFLSWTSTLLYLGSRLPQLYKNYVRKSTAGLSPHLFLAAFCGNAFYSSALLTNPCAWEDMEPHGGFGWAGSRGSDRAAWVLAALPFFLGAFGVLGLDASVGMQFLIYGEGAEKIVVVEEVSGSAAGGRGSGKGRWRRVSGWMRGWVPGTARALERDSGAGGAGGVGEREGLLTGRGEGYGGL